MSIVETFMICATIAGAAWAIRSELSKLVSDEVCEKRMDKLREEIIEPCITCPNRPDKNKKQ